MAKRKILIVEDDRTIVDSLTILLKNDYEMESAEDGNVGLAKAASFKPDLIILDLMMPERDGFDVSKQLKKNDAMKDIPVIVLSSFTELYGMSFGDEASRGSLPTEVYLSKPVDPPTLLRLIRQYLK